MLYMSKLNHIYNRAMSHTSESHTVTHTVSYTSPIRLSHQTMSQKGSKTASETRTPFQNPSIPPCSDPAPLSTTTQSRMRPLAATVEGQSTTTRPISVAFEPHFSFR